MILFKFQDYLIKMLEGNPKYTLKNAELYFSRYYKDFLQYYKNAILEAENIKRQREWSGFIYNVQQSIDNLAGYVKEVHNLQTKLIAEKPTFRGNLLKAVLLSELEGKEDETEYYDDIYSSYYLAEMSLKQTMNAILNLTDFMYSGIEEPDESWTDKVYRQKEYENYQIWLQELTTKYMFDMEFRVASLKHFMLLEHWLSNMKDDLKLYSNNVNIVLTNIDNELRKHIGE